MAEESDEKAGTLNFRVSKASIILLVGTAFVAAIQYVASSWLRNPATELDNHGNRIGQIEKRLDKLDPDYIDQELEELRTELDDAQYDIKTCQRNMNQVISDISLHENRSEEKFRDLDKQYTILDFQINQCMKKVE